MLDWGGPEGVPQLTLPSAGRMAFYTMAQWHVKPGNESAFEEAWHEAGRAFGRVPGAPPVEGTLIRRTDNPLHYASFGAWPDMASIQAMRADPGVQAAIARVQALCTESDPGNYEVVRVMHTQPTARAAR